MDVENLRNNFEMTFLPLIVLYLYRPTYFSLFIVLTVLAVGKGHIYKTKLKELLDTLGPIPVENATPIARRRRRRGSE
jgi:hypothetical protein